MKRILLLVLVLTTFNVNSQCWSKIAQGETHTIAIKTDGTLWTSGANGAGQLGMGDNLNRTTFTQVGSANNWSKIAAGNLTSLALKTDGSLWVWGISDGGFNTPTQLGTGFDWKEIACGSLHFLAIKNDGTLWTWGSDSNGQIGDGGTLSDKEFSIQVGTDKDWSKITAGSKCSFGIRTNGTLWSWGQNTQGQLGLNFTSSSVRAPTQVGTDTNWDSISSGLSHSLALKSDGTLWFSGANFAGQGGTGTSNSSSTFIQVGLETNWSKMSACYSHSLAIKKDGTLWSWGFNGLQGLLGDGTTTLRTSPIQIGSQTNWNEVIGKNTSMGLNLNNEFWVWGSNSFGTFGNGTTTNSTIPINVACASLDTQAFSKSEFRIYPNPSSSQINVSFENNLEKVNLKVISILGQTVLEKQNISGTNLSLDVSGLSNGTYIIQVKNNNSIRISKFIKH